MRPFFFALTIALPTLAFADPSYHRVTGVAADDTLNVRAAPSASSADIGDLSPWARAIEVSGTDTSGKWARIVWGESNGWIATRFLAPDHVARIGGTGIPENISCFGTEPFWSVDFTATQAHYSDPDGSSATIPLIGAMVAEGRSRTPALIGFARPGTKGDAVFSPASCSDGMSDRTYPWSVQLLLTQGGTRRFMHGCCHLPH